MPTSSLQRWRTGLGGVGFLTCLVALGTTCQRARSPEAAAPALAARVNGEIITRAEVEEHTRLRLLEEGPVDAARTTAVTAYVLHALVEETVLAQAARARGLRVTVAEVDAAAKAVRAQYPGATTVSDGMLRQRLERQLLSRALIETLASDVVVTPEELAAAVPMKPLPGRTQPVDPHQRLLTGKRAIERNRRIAAIKAAAHIEQFFFVGPRLVAGG